MSRINPERSVPILSMLLGMFIICACGISPLAYAVIEKEVAAAAFGGFWMLAGFGLTALGLWWYRTQKPKYAVAIRTASGEVKALMSDDRQKVEQIVAALSQAFADRG